MLSVTYRREEKKAALYYTKEALIRRFIKEMEEIEEYQKRKQALRDFLKEKGCKTTIEYTTKYDAEDDDPFWNIVEDYEDMITRFV